MRCQTRFLNCSCLIQSVCRLRKISEEVSVPILQARRRSNSLPIPHIEISVYQGTNSNSRDSPSGNTLKDFIEVPDQMVTGMVTDCSDSSDSRAPPADRSTGTIERRANSERKRNVKIASFKSLIESKIFSKSEKELECIGLDKVKKPAGDATSTISQEDNEVRISNFCTYPERSQIVFFCYLYPRNEHWAIHYITKRKFYRGQHQ